MYLSHHSVQNSSESMIHWHLEKECKVNLRLKQPWYDNEMKELKRKVCRHEKKWLTYKLDSLWTTYKKVRNSYYGKLNAKKRTVLQTKIEDCTKDSCKLHALVQNPTSKKVEQEWPEHTSKEDMAEDFTSYFQGKMKRLESYLKISPNTLPGPQMFLNQ